MLYNVVMQMPDGSVEHWCRDVTDPNLLHLAVKAACSARKGADVYVCYEVICFLSLCAIKCLLADSI